MQTLGSVYPIDRKYCPTMRGLFHAWNSIFRGKNSSGQSIQSPVLLPFGRCYLFSTVPLSPNHSLLLPALLYVSGDWPVNPLASLVLWLLVGLIQFIVLVLTVAELFVTVSIEALYQSGCTFPWYSAPHSFISFIGSLNLPQLLQKVPLLNSPQWNPLREPSISFRARI